MIETYRSDEESGGGLVEDDEGEIAAEMADDVARRVRSPVTEGLVSFDHQNHLVRRFGQAVLLPQTPQIVQNSLE